MLKLLVLLFTLFCFAQCKTLGDPSAFWTQYFGYQLYDAYYQESYYDWTQRKYTDILYLPDTIETYLTDYKKGKAYYVVANTKGKVQSCDDIWKQVKNQEPVQHILNSETDHFATGYMPDEVNGYRGQSSNVTYWYDLNWKLKFLSLPTDMVENGETVGQFAFIQKYKKSTPDSEYFEVPKECSTMMRSVKTPEELHERITNNIRRFF
eukprot:TRINITY_DN1371_c0_g1_i1.p1 TRINITY_DN1371_c0_g1~~TRINITY_DN1371_c0_g1_i1.p1  ORF type:complete len:208 (+),score=28.52 TRINITY_DN1371_c0_g1_i1:109-732(+)